MYHSEIHTMEGVFPVVWSHWYSCAYLNLKVCQDDSLHALLCSQGFDLLDHANQSNISYAGYAVDLHVEDQGG